MYIFSSKIPIASAAFLLIAASAFLLPDLAVFYINNQVVDPVNTDAEFPSEEFEGTNLYGPEGQKLEPVEIMRSDSGRLEKRLKIAGAGLIDLRRSGSAVLEATRGPVSNPDRIGINTSPEGCQQIAGCGKGYSPAYSQIPGGWFSILTETGNMHEFYRNDTLREKFNDYAYRAEFYDSYLNPDGYEMREIEAAYYSSKSGVYVVGASDQPIQIDGMKVETETHGTLHHAEIALDSGSYTVRRGDSKIKLVVHPKLRNYVREEGKLLLDQVNETDYRILKIHHADSLRKVDLEEGNMSIELEGNPRKISFVKEGVSVNRSLGEEYPDYSPAKKLAFGMSREEYRRFRTVSELLGIQRGFQEN